MAWEHEQAKQGHKTQQNWQKFFHSVMMTYSGEELKLVAGGEFFTLKDDTP